MTDESVSENLAKVGIKVSPEQVKAWSPDDKAGANNWASLAQTAEKQKAAGLKPGAKKIRVPQKPDFLRKF